MRPEYRFKLDENLPLEAEFLQSLGYDAVTATMQGLNGLRDPVIAAKCKDEGRIIVTIDLDFSDIRKYPPADFSGIIVLRFSKQGFEPIMRAFSRIIEYLESEPLDHHLWILTERRLRIRKGLGGNGA